MVLKPWFLSIFILVISLFSNGYSEQKKVYIITGPEASGSRFIARVIAYVVGKDRKYKSWDGHGVNGEIGDDVLVVHHSQPAFRPAKFSPLERFQTLFKDYDRFFIITTRDQNIIRSSKRRQYRNSVEELKQHENRSKEIMTDIFLKERCFIWSYETQFYLKRAYFQKLYDFLGIQSDFYPSDLFDANQKYIKN